MTFKDEPLFDLPTAPPTKRAKSLRELDREAKPSIVRYRLKNRLPCDECITLLVENNGQGPYAASVRWKATFEGRVLLLCNAHADLWNKKWKKK